jgi:hypothetical protein
LAIGRTRKKQPAELADDFAMWSQGRDIRKASVPVLAEYLDHLQQVAQA